MSESFFSEAMQDSGINDSALAILQHYLNGTPPLTAQITAERILAADPDPGYMLVRAASELPAAHNQLVDIVAAMKQSSANSMAGLYIELREAWNHLDSDTSAAYHSEDCTQWININAWAARLLHRLPDESFLRFGFYTIREALESTSPPQQSQTEEATLSANSRALDGLVPAAAQWILISGQEMYASDFSISELGMPRSREAWGRWRQGFTEAGRNEELDEETRMIAQEAAERMGTIRGTS
ncbi:MAG: hypothetical protein Q9187_004615 [Circinaria calcarea]